MFDGFYFSILAYICMPRRLLGTLCFQLYSRQ